MGVEAFSMAWKIYEQARSLGGDDGAHLLKVSHKTVKVEDAHLAPWDKFVMEVIHLEVSLEIFLGVSFGSPIL